LVAVVAFAAVIAAQTDSKTAPGLPSPVEHFMQKVGQQPTAEAFYKQVPDGLWEVYPQDDTLKASLLDVVKNGADGPQLAFSALALISFHDPSTVRPMIQRAMDPRINPATRWCLLNAAPYVLGMGDVMYLGEGKIDAESNELADTLKELGDQASQSGTGHAHAVNLRKLLDAPASVKKDQDYGLAVWHQSAYLLGTLDLKDEKLLSKALTFGNRAVFQNVVISLGFAVNRDFLADLKKKRMAQVTSAMEQEVGKRAGEWWQKYLDTHAEGKADNAVMAGFEEAGYHLETDLKSEASRRELLRALNDPHPEIRYNVYKLFNQIYGTHFDLDIAFFAGKYALSFLDPSDHEKDNEARLKRYWQNRLNPQAAATPSLSVALQATSGNANSAADPPAGAASLAETAGRLKEQKESQQKDQTSSPK